MNHSTLCVSSLLRKTTVPYKGACSTQRQRRRILPALDFIFILFSVPRLRKGLQRKWRRHRYWRRSTRRGESTAAPGDSPHRVDRRPAASGLPVRPLDRASGPRVLESGGVHSLTPLDPPPLARRPQPGSTRRREWAPAEGESTARHYRARRHFLCGPFLDCFHIFFNPSTTPYLHPPRTRSG